MVFLNKKRFSGIFSTVFPYPCRKTLLSTPSSCFCLDGLLKYPSLPMNLRLYSSNNWTHQILNTCPHQLSPHPLPLILLNSWTSSWRKRSVCFHILLWGNNLLLSSEQWTFLKRLSLWFYPRHLESHGMSM